MAKKPVNRTFNVSVIGLSGTEKEKGQGGVGKSCLCNRFINPDADNYHSEHISVVSQSDFGGRVINNDHFLYWGEVMKMDEGNNFTFRVIEQTEFIDDVSFSPFKTGRTDSYLKRCVLTKVQSAEKLMYICKDQLGMETDSSYEQKVIPDGRLTIDGFLCCFDVSRVLERSIEKQVDFCCTFLNNAMKTKKPIVLVTTKNDAVESEYVKEVEKLLMRKEYKNTIALVETSAHENVNVETAFLLLAHMIDRSKLQAKITPFNEARKARKEILEVALELFKNLLRSQITDSKITWTNACKKLEKQPDYQHYVELFGTDKACMQVKQHARYLREEMIKQKQNSFMKQLPDILNLFLPDFETIGATTSWNSCRSYMMCNSEFGSYFKKVCEDGRSWKDTDFVDAAQISQLPVDILYTTEAEMCFRNHVNRLKAAQKREELKQEFRALLERFVDRPGCTLVDYNHLFIGKECFLGLQESERQLVYEDYQRELKQRLRIDFQELLWERLSVFQYLNLDPKAKLTEDDLNFIYNSLNDDQRFRKFYKLEDDRRVMLLNHVVFLEKPSVEWCIFHLECGVCKCTECQVSRILKNQRHLVSNGSVKCKFVDIPPEDLAEKLKFYPEQIEEAPNCIVHAPGQMEKIMEDTEPDLRLLICMMCSDPFPMEIPLQPFLNESSFLITSDPSKASINLQEDNMFTINVAIDNAIQKVEVTVTSYHGGQHLLQKGYIYHGYILVYCPKRRASLASLKSFAESGGCMLFLAVPEAGTSHYSLNKHSQGLKDGKDFAIIKSASFMQSNSNFSNQGASKVYDKFLRDVWDRREELVYKHYDDPGFPLPYHDDMNDHRSSAVLSTILTNHTENHINGQNTEEPLYDQPNNIVQLPSSHHHTFSTCPPLPSSTPPPFVDSLFPFRNENLPVKPSMLKTEQDQYAEPVYDDLSQNEDNQLIWCSNDLYDRTPLLPKSKVNQKQLLHVQCIQAQRPSSAGKSHANAPLALPEKIEISDIYGTVKDGLTPENDYAIVDDALPKSKVIRIKSRKSDICSDTDESEYSSSKRDKEIYSNVSGKLAQHNKKQKHWKQDVVQNVSWFNVKHKQHHRHSSDTERLIEHQEVLTGMNDNNEDVMISLGTDVTSHKVRSEDNDLDLKESNNVNVRLRKKVGKDSRSLEKKFKDEERRQQREDEKKQKELQKLQKKFCKKKDNNIAGQPESGTLSLNDFPMSPNNPSVPQFIENCVKFIEAEGLYAEGIYRIPGNKAQVDKLTAKFTEDINVNLWTLEIQVNAVAAVLKAVFSDLVDPLVPVSLYDDLIDSSGEQDKKARLMSLRGVFLKIHPLNFEVLKFLITHLNKVSQNCDLNSMDSKNLACCWRPILFRMEWDTYEETLEFSRISKEILQTLIEQCRFFFHSGNEI